MRGIVLRAASLREFARGRRRGWLLGGLAVAAFAVSAAVLARVARDAKAPTLRISAGNTEGMWYPAVLALAREAPPSRLRLEPVVTKGSLAMIRLRLRGGGRSTSPSCRGGSTSRPFPDIRRVAGLSVEPVHLLVRPGLHVEVTADLGKLRGRTINLSTSTRAGIYWLGREILAFAGLDPDDYRAASHSSESIVAERDPARLPDALFIATTPPRRWSTTSSPTPATGSSRSRSATPSGSARSTARRRPRPRAWP